MEASTKPASFVVDARSGEKHSFAELCPGAYLPSPSAFMPLVGWYSEHVFAFSNTEIIFFADIERHQVKRCGMPAGDLNGRFSNSFQFSITQRGIFAAHLPVSARGELRLLRFAPELAEADSLTLHAAAGTSPGIEASADGQWLLVNDFEGSRTRNLWRLARLANGAETAVLVTDNSSDKGLIPPLWQVKGFIPGSHQILLHSEAELGLFDADSHALRRIPIEGGASVNSVHLSPGGQFALVEYYSIVTGDGRVIHPLSMVDLKGGASSNFSHVTMDKREIYPESPAWLGDDHLLFRAQPWLIITNRDGTGARPLLAK